MVAIMIPQIRFSDRPLKLVAVLVSARRKANFGSFLAVEEH
jgi:hypothetical protein